MINTNPKYLDGSGRNENIKIPPRTRHDPITNW